MSPRQWSRDLAMGARFAVTGGREGWVRMTLTAVGVGLGVALLLLCTAMPNVFAARSKVEDARYANVYSRTVPPKADNTLLIADADTTWHDDDIQGRFVEPEGRRAPLPPGVDRFPGKGEMVVSPALKDLLDSDDAKLLRERLPYKITGTIGESGLIGSHELAYYAGASGLKLTDSSLVARLTKFGKPDATPEKTDPVLLLMVLVVFVVLLTPVAVFIAAAVRFGGERRDRRLAALRLVGSDRGMTRRIAAGEALAGALLGLAVGTGFFLLGRQKLGTGELLGVSVWPSYLDPTPALAALVAVAVPVSAVLVTLLAMRGVVVEPLGVVRAAKQSRRRLWWRLLPTLAGLGMLYPMIGQGHKNGNFNQYLVIGGVLMLLIGITALLPWVVEAVVVRLGKGPLSWQLAVRRLQLSSGTAARMVNGIAVAVAGAIALQMLFTGTQSQYTENTGKDPSRVQMQVDFSGPKPLSGIEREFTGTKGVRAAVALARSQYGDSRRNPKNSNGLTVGDCAALRELATLPSCKDGDVFITRTRSGYSAPSNASEIALVKPGRQLYIDPSYDGAERGLEVPWTVPANVREVNARKDSLQDYTSLLVTPAVLPHKAAPAVFSDGVYLRLDPSVPDSREYIRNVAARIDPLAQTYGWSATQEDVKYTSIRTGLFVGSAFVLALIGASLLVSQLEQLRERRKLLSALVAFGTRRRTLSLSVLWQTALPVGLGLVLATTVGVTLGAVLLKMTRTPVTMDWASVLTMTGVGTAVVGMVTLLSLPPLLRMMRPAGLRTE
ncbi:ABC transporter permease (plasmid) [Streptomyces sp. NBC_01340]|uniref:ABC transporter permease n=1 Tax=unclassified Streptomyces TaxID=2593676 RepID=UPI00225826D1|nr:MULTISPECIES: ABC transporter permease [unclassified Streptomyces]MCX4460271.1 ABC transporter permease [Streptomyces sp. NBC_01719]MCX4500398.1 ABC transporter permease [Streptomyces sp. NBC_01728]WSI45442.1 ABC transporter permease [Streptomyces sp. NBC_01340]